MVSPLIAMRFAGSVLTTPWDYLWLPHSGQSLALGGEQAPVSTSQPFNNKMLHSPSGTYSFDDPNDPTLQAIPLVTPQKLPLSTGADPYPTNCLGESSEVPAANDLTAMALANGYRVFNIAASTVGQGGAPFSVIKKAGSGNAYEAGLYECAALKNLLGKLGCIGFLFEHGEADSQNNVTAAAYLSDLEQFQLDNETDINALLARAGRLPLISSQQHSLAGSFNGPASSAIADWQGSLASPSRLVLLGPKYQYPYAPDNIHLSDYRPLAKKQMQVLWALLNGRVWTPLSPLSIVRVGATITITLHVPFGPLLFDSQPGPHGPGTPWSVWGPGKGHELGDRPFTVLGTTGTGVSPIVVQTDGNAAYSNGDAVALSVIGGNTNANGVFSGAQVTILDDFHIQLNGTTGNGNFAMAPIPPTGYSPIPIVSAAIDGAQVVLTAGRTPLSAMMTVGYANESDRVWNAACGGMPGGRCGLLRDSDPVQPNWCIQYLETIS